MFIGALHADSPVCTVQQWLYAYVRLTLKRFGFQISAVIVNACTAVVCNQITKHACTVYQVNTGVAVATDKNRQPVV